MGSHYPRLPNRSSQIRDACKCSSNATGTEYRRRRSSCHRRHHIIVIVTEDVPNSGGMGETSLNPKAYILTP